MRILMIVMNLSFLLSAHITFIANEGNFGSSNGSISMIFEDGSIQETGSIGDVVQSLEVYGDKLIVLINNSSKIKIYDITENGLSMPGIEIDTNGSGPRESVVVEDKIYFTNWNSQDVKIFNLFNYTFEESIPINGLPEDIAFDGEYLWVTVPHSDFYFNTGSKIEKIDITSNSVVDIIEVGSGPQQIEFLNDDLYISRTYYDASFNTFHGTSKISDFNQFDMSVSSNNYGSGAPCGGAVIKHQDSILRSFNGGLALLNNDLSLQDPMIGSFQQWQVYHVEKIDDEFWFGITDFGSLNEVHVLDENGVELAVYQSGLFPGDFARWNLCSNTTNGDVNADNELNVLDINQTIFHIIDLDLISDICSLNAADMNHDGLINIQDVVLMVSIVLNDRIIGDASNATLIRNNERMLLDADGYIGGVQMTLTHGDNFNISITENALAANYNTIGNKTKLVIAGPQTDELFSAFGNYTIEEVIIANSIEEVLVTLPSNIQIEDAYPNPFNPSTVLNLNINKPTNASLIAYDITGRSVDVIFDGKLDAGTKSISWNASNLPSGTYIIKLTTDDGSASIQKVTLMK